MQILLAGLIGAVIYTVIAMVTGHAVFGSWKKKVEEKVVEKKLSSLSEHDLVDWTALENNLYSASDYWLRKEKAVKRAEEMKVTEIEIPIFSPEVSNTNRARLQALRERRSAKVSN